MAAKALRSVPANSAVADEAAQSTLKDELAKLGYEELP